MELPSWAASLGHSIAAPSDGRGRAARQLEPELNRVSGNTAGSAFGSGSKPEGSITWTAGQPVPDPLEALGVQGPGFSPGNRSVSRQSEPEVQVLRSGSPVGQPHQQDPSAEQAGSGHMTSVGRGSSGSQVCSCGTQASFRGYIK